MNKDKNINLKLELVKDPSSGKIILQAHFDSKAPNIKVNDNGYFWIPTLEEKDLINEAFHLINSENPPVKHDIIPTVKPEREEIKNQKNQSVFQEPPKEEKQESPAIETKEEPAVFEVTNEEINDNKDINKEHNLEMKPEVEITQQTTGQTDQQTKQNEEEEGIIVEADDDAIEAALKKHIGQSEEDNSMVEADEKTILDRVLSQKKKGKWTKK